MNIDPRSLTDARLQLHWAAQLAATVGRTLAPPRADDSHTSFLWSEKEDALVQEPPLSSGLRLRDLTLIMSGQEFPLDGRTIDEGFAWLQQQAPGVRKEFNDPMPDHPVAHGEPFHLDGAKFAELARYYREAAAILKTIDADVRCWPHHFDIAVLLSFDGGAKTIGVGMSPGDEGRDEPYWYVNHWPRASTTSLPPLAGGGTWNTEGWLGGVLPASANGDVRAFVDSALKASRDLIGVHA